MTKRLRIGLRVLSLVFLAIGIAENIYSHRVRQRLDEAHQNLQALERATNHPDLSSNIIHFPKSGKCPDHYSVVVRAFHWQDGLTYPACVDFESVRHNGVHIDVLLSGESIEIGFELTAPDDPSKKI